ncbi:MAG: response regulator transcription factor [Lachnospiraceae bacterium]|nr:response regulator transcription factor [Lachnospiraceae bacterium]
MTDILLLEDNKELNTLMCAFLEKAGYQVKGIETGEEAMEWLEQEQAKLLILDVMLSGMDGFAVCSAIREKSSVPILFLSARVEKEAKMSGFALGADDYIEKPVDMDILLAKVQALMKRNYDLKQKNTLLHSGALSIDKESRQVFLDGKELTLTVKEYELLLLLVENPGKTLHKDFLFGKIWGMDSFSENQTLTVHIKMLRDKIEEDSKHPKRIQTVWGVGYKYEEIS